MILKCLFCGFESEMHAFNKGDKYYCPSCKKVHCDFEVVERSTFIKIDRIWAKGNLRRFIHEVLLRLSASEVEEIYDVLIQKSMEPRMRNKRDALVELTESYIKVLEEGE